MAERTMVFIDGNNINISVSHKRRHAKVDWEKFKNFLLNFGNIVSISIYFSEIKFTEHDGHTNGNLQNFMNYLKYLRRIGYRVYFKPATPVFNHGDCVGYKSNCDPEMVTDMIMSCMIRKVDHIILVSGDRDFVYPISKIGGPPFLVRTTVMGMQSSFSQELQEVADQSFFLDRCMSDFLFTD